MGKGPWGPEGHTKAWREASGVSEVNETRDYTLAHTLSGAGPAPARALSALAEGYTLDKVQPQPIYQSGLVSLAL